MMHYITQRRKINDDSFISNYKPDAMRVINMKSFFKYDSVLYGYLHMLIKYFLRVM